MLALCGSFQALFSSFFFIFNHSSILSIFVDYYRKQTVEPKFPSKKTKKIVVIHVSLNKCIFCKYPCQIFISFDVIMCLTLIWCCHSMFVRRLYFGNEMKYFVLPNIIVCLKRTGENEKYPHLFRWLFWIS